MSRAILISYLCMILFGFADNIRGPLYPEILNQFSVNNSVGAWFFGVASTASVLGALLTKVAIHRWGYRLSFARTMLLLALSLGGISISPVFSVMIFFVFFLGISFGALGVLQNAAVSSASRDDALLRYQSGLHALYGIFSFLAPLMTALVFSFLPSWRLPFAILAFFAVLIVWVILRGEEFSEKPKTIASHHFEVSSAFPKMIFWAFILSLYVVAEIEVATRLAQFMKDTQQFDFATASIAVSVFFGGMFLSRALAMVVHLRISLVWQMMGCLGLSALLIFLGTVQASERWGNCWLVALSGLTMGPFYPMAMTWLARKFQSEIETVVTACLTVQGLLVLSMHWGAGVLTDRFGIAKALLVAPIALVLALFLILSERLRR